MKKITDRIKEKPWLGWVLFGATILVVFIIGLFVSTIMERRGETYQLQQVGKPIGEWEPRLEVWGENFPRQYETYMKTSDTTFASKYLGSGKIDLLEQNPKYVILWAGFAFSRDYGQARGHYYAITDVINSLRTVQPQPSTCWTCKSSDVPRLMNEMGIDSFYRTPIKDLGHEVVNPIGCLDCHDPKTMNLRLSRPALIEAYQRQGIDPKNFSHQEMKSQVCAQCHSEYYFKGPGRYLVFPWDEGFTVEQMEKFYDDAEHTDWVHALSRAPMLKSQHPDYEIYKLGIHGKRGVACADCHMPYKTEGAVKFTDHHIQSPLSKIDRSCQVCHRESEETLRQNVYSLQDKVKELAKISEEALVKAHLEAKYAWDNGATEAMMKPVLTLIRHSQWRSDFVTSSLGAAFHAPSECLRILGTSIDKAQEARLELAKVFAELNVKKPVIDLANLTKAKAQEMIGLNMEQIRSDKNEFLKNVLPVWEKKAAERQAKMNY